MSLAHVRDQLARHESNARYWEGEARRRESRLADLSASLSTGRDQLDRAIKLDAACSSVIDSLATYESDVDGLGRIAGYALLRDVAEGAASMHAGMADLADQAKTESAALVERLSGEVAGLETAVNTARSDVEAANASADSARRLASSVRMSIRSYGA